MASSTPSSSYSPRAFPPTNLQHVPAEYIVTQLRHLAVHYWNKPASADCTIVVPVPHAKRPASRNTSSLSPSPSFASSLHELSGTGQRVTQSVTPPPLPRIVVKGHLDYLMANSTLLRGIFGGDSPLDLITSVAASSPLLRQSAALHSGHLAVPANRHPRLLPSSPGHPMLYLPVPDPSSLPALLHWIYFGSKDHLRDALDQGTVQWEGLARNVEYLGLTTDIKVFLGKYYKAWLHTEGGRFDEYLAFADEDSEDEEDCESDCDSDDTAYDTCLSDVDEDEAQIELKVKDLGFDALDDALSIADSATVADDDIGSVGDLEDDENAMWRGRSRATRCVSTSYDPSDPPLNFSENRRWSA